jgi:tetratricopeptide (TPR) repeat protein
VGLTDDLLLHLTESLAGQGDERLADGLSLATLKRILREPVLLVIDELQRGFQPGTGKPGKALALLLKEFAGTGAGRLLLLSSRDLDRERANERWAVRRLRGLAVDEAVELFDHLLAAEGVDAAIPLARKRDIAKYLGGYPRALSLFANRLRYEPLDELLGLAYEAWEGKDRQVSPELLAGIETEMFQRAREGLDAPAERFLQRLAVFRHPIEPDALARLLDPGEDLPSLRAELIDRFVIELRRQRYAMPSLLRDTVLASLPAEPKRRAQRMAGDWFARHFRARRIVGPPERLGGAFVEARYHFVQAADEDALREIGRRFEAHVRATIDWVTPLPQDQAEADERIAFLYALLSDGAGPKGLHYYLARLLDHRRRNDDLQRAVTHARAGTGPQSPSAAWVLRIRLEAEVEGIDRIEALVQDHARGRGAYDDVYQAAGRVLDDAGETERALALLRKGIAKIPTSQPLYQAAGEILDRSGNPDDAVALLREGIGKVPANKNLFSLYQALGRILERCGDSTGALATLREGLARLPSGRTGNRYRVAGSLLYLAYAASDRDRLTEASSWRGNEALDQAQQALAAVLSAELSGDWVKAAELAARSGAEHPRYLDLATREGFSRLCAGEPGEAVAALERFPQLRDTEAGNPLTWLRSLAALSAQDLDDAQGYLGLFLGSSVTGDLNDLRQRLLRAWDESPGSDSAQPVAHYFPHLPPSLTGLDHTITRRQFGPAVLSDPDSLLDPSPNEDRP